MVQFGPSLNPTEVTVAGTDKPTVKKEKLPDPMAPISDGTLTFAKADPSPVLEAGSFKAPEKPVEEVDQDAGLPFRVFVNTQGNYYAAKHAKSSADSELPHPTKNLLDSLTSRPGSVADKHAVRQSIIDHGNGEPNLEGRTNTGVMP